MMHKAQKCNFGLNFNSCMINVLKLLSLIARVNFSCTYCAKIFPKGPFNKLIDIHPHQEKKQAIQQKSIIPHKLVIA